MTRSRGALWALTVALSMPGLGCASSATSLISTPDAVVAETDSDTKQIKKTKKKRANKKMNRRMASRR